MTALVAWQGVSVSAIGEDVVGLRVPPAVLQQQSRETLERIFDRVLLLGIEVWLEGDEYVFRRPKYPPVNREAHVRRHAWLLDAGKGRCR